MDFSKISRIFWTYLQNILIRQIARWMISLFHLRRWYPFILGFFIILGKIFEVDVTALATGLGIGGIAIAMASKESLENLLGSFTIFFDRPFTVGDIVTAGSVTGVVEKVGFRSTRIRTFDKSIVTVPNKNMISAELDNLGERPVRRAKFMIGLTYDSTIEQIKAIVTDIQKMIDIHPKTNQDARVRFQEFGGSSLDIMIIYYVDSPKWDDFIDTKEDINYQIMEIVQKHKCDLHSRPQQYIAARKLNTNNNPILK